MTAPMIDPGARGDDPTRLATARETVAEPTTRFADLLSREAGTAVPPGQVPPRRVADLPAPPGDAEADAERAPITVRAAADATSLVVVPGAALDAPSAQARLFNQDGFFGRPDVIAAAEIAPRAEAAADPVPASAAVVAGMDAIIHGATSTPPVPAGAASVVRPFAVGTAQAPVTPMSGGGARPSPASVARAPAPFRPADATRPGKPAAPARPLPRPVATPAAAVAVALHAAARGIEAAAQIAGLDEHDRAALADEIAALLSAHGYAPAQINVIAAPRAARQEHR